MINGTSKKPKDKEVKEVAEEVNPLFKVKRYFKNKFVYKSKK